MGYARSMAKWQSTVDLQTLQQRGQLVYKNPDGRHQLALFHHQGRCFAVDNRCPHEGYPLSQGTVDKDCILTCNWHNWKFTLEKGQNLYGGDGLRTYPVEVRDGTVWVDVQDPPREQVEQQVLAGLRNAVEDADHGWIARELARLQRAGIDPRVGVCQTLQDRLDRLEYGATHCLAATADWLALYAEFGEQGADLEDRLICLTEAIEHIADDSLRRPTYAFAEPSSDPFTPEQLAAAIEAEQADPAIAMVRRALADGMSYGELQPCLARAALGHYLGFGHGLIYVVKAGELVDTLGPRVAEPVAAAVVRYLAYATREDLIPEFRDYASYVGQLPPEFGPTLSPPNAERIVGAPLSTVLGWVCEQATNHRPEAIYDALVWALATNMLRFDTAHSMASRVKVANNVGWLDFTHGLTFANAVHTTCQTSPGLWGAGLLQLGCFVARNRRYLGDSQGERWRVKDVSAFFTEAVQQLLDHGMVRPIHACHLLKTTLAVRAELTELSPQAASRAVAALNRFLHEPIKQKHVRRNVHQALALVGR